MSVGAMTDKLMKIPVVAWRLSTSESFVYGLIADGRLKHFRLGKGQGGLRVSEEQLQAYLLLSEEGGEDSTAPTSLREISHHSSGPS